MFEVSEPIERRDFPLSLCLNERKNHFADLFLNRYWRICDMWAVAIEIWFGSLVEEIKLDARACGILLLSFTFKSFR